MDAALLWVGLVAASGGMGIAVRVRTKRPVAGLGLVGGAVVLVAGLADAILAERYGDDVLSFYVVLGVLAVVVWTRWDAWPLGTAGWVAVVSGLALAAAYLLGGLVNGDGFACWTICPAITRIDELSVLAAGVGLLLFVLGLGWDAAWRATRRLIDRRR